MPAPPDFLNCQEVMRWPINHPKNQELPLPPRLNHPLAFCVGRGDQIAPLDVKSCGPGLFCAQKLASTLVLRNQPSEDEARTLEALQS